MKKLLCLAMISVLILSGCGEKTDIEETAVEEGIVKGATVPGKYSTSDFILYTLDDENYPSMAVAVLGADRNTIEYTDEKAKTAAEGIVFSSDKVTETAQDGTVTEKDIINSFSYEKGRIPLTNSKGIVTTGLVSVDTDKNCSKAEEIIRAYTIDEENEEYITNVNDDGSYTIDLYFMVEDIDGNVERIVTPKGGDLNDNIKKARYCIRFHIVNDYVHGIDCMII